MNIFHIEIFRADLFSRTTTSLREFARNFIRAIIYMNKVFFFVQYTNPIEFHCRARHDIWFLFFHHFVKNCLHFCFP